ncbi:type I restriction-modification system subunit M N-terminal domain-containing protein [Streptosporangium sp. NPDC023615]|uniref:type I restriction-modification system subunit M N-terminal domain-containing protein n=1 Tax=Streptosporangium sp. NPDC023615 TaxID=3154794 RepID=UPI00341CACA5
MSGNHQKYADFIWSVADLLRGDYRQSEYGKVILPFTVLRRIDCVLEPTKKDVLAEKARLKDALLPPRLVEIKLRNASGASFYNTSPLEFGGLGADSDNVARNLRSYIGGFSPGAVEVLEKYRFDEQITRLQESGLLYLVASKFAEIDLHPDVVDNHQMGYVFEELIRKFSEISNETAGEHFTPREVIRLMVNLLMAPDDRDVMTPGIVRPLKKKLRTVLSAV